MTVDKLFPSGDYVCSNIVKGVFVKMRYNGYTKRESMQLFREYCKTL